MEKTLLHDEKHRHTFTNFKSEICHDVKRMGDLDFIITTLESDKIRHYFEKQWHLESFYLLAMIDYLCKEHNLPLCTNYNDIRSLRLQKTIYPSSVVMMCELFKSDQPKKECLKEAIPEFMRFNIVEGSIRDVC